MYGRGAERGVQRGGCSVYVVCKRRVKKGHSTTKFPIEICFSSHYRSIGQTFFSRYFKSNSMLKVYTFNLLLPSQMEIKKFFSLVLKVLKCLNSTLDWLVHILV